MKKTGIILLFILWCAHSVFAQVKVDRNPEVMIGEWEFIPTGIILNAYRPVFVPIDDLPEDVKNNILYKCVLGIDFIDMNFITLSSPEQGESAGIYFLSSVDRYMYVTEAARNSEPFYDEVIYRLSIVTSEMRTIEFLFRQTLNGELEMFQTTRLYVRSEYGHSRQYTTVIGSLHHTEDKKVDLSSFLNVYTFKSKDDYEGTVFNKILYGESLR